MRKALRSLFFAVSSTVLIVLTAQAGSCPTFTFETFRIPLECPGKSVPNAPIFVSGLNDAGQAVGFYSDCSFNFHGFLRSPSGGPVASMDDDFARANVVGLVQTFANGINNHGEVIGDRLASDGYRGFKRLADGTILSVPDFPGALSTDHLGIGDSGEVVGDYTADSPTRPVYGFAGSASYNLGTFTQVLGINGAGVVVGDFFRGDDPGRAHGFADGGEISVPDYVVQSIATGINDAGVIVGWFNDGKHGRGFRLVAGQFCPIDPPGAADTYVAAVNNAGKFAGTMNIGGASFGFIGTPKGALKVYAALFDGAETSVTVTGSPITATLPLGSLFSLRLADATGAPISATYAISNSSRSSTPSSEALFPDSVVILFFQFTTSLSIPIAIPFFVLPTGPLGQQQFAAVHLGSAELTITPSEPAFQPVKVSVRVVTPTLGQPMLPGVDPSIISAADRFGIPPALLKGQMDQESKFRGVRFNGEAYRYEPGYDKTNVERYLSDCDSNPIFAANHQSFCPGYNLFRLATRTGLSQGLDLMLPDDVEPRGFYCIRAGGVIRPISTLLDDPFVSADNIYSTNNVPRSPPSACPPAPQNWPSLRPRDLTFTAQTTLASSYGLLQVLYPTATWIGGWDLKNPSELFGLPEAIGLEGSLTVGTRVLTYHVAHLNSCLTAPRSCASLLQSAADFLIAFVEALNAYNHPPYGDVVIEKTVPFLPEAPANILQ